MTVRLVLDTESDDLADHATVTHCIVATDLDTREVFRFYGDTSVPGDHGSIAVGVQWLLRADELIGHNIIDHDIPMMERLYGVRFTNTLTDTLVMSRALNPDRTLPQGCPGAVFNPITGKSDRIGPHSIAAWGYRVGRKKPEHHDWRVFTPEMLHRCAEDVAINVMVYQALLVECGGEPLPSWLRMEMQVSRRAKRMAQRGWLVDRPKIEQHIATLDKMIADIEAEVMPRIPETCVCHEKAVERDEDENPVLYHHVTKPFLKSGKWSKSVEAWWPELEQHPAGGVVNKDTGEGRFNWEIGGPFTRVGFEKINLRSDAQIKKYLLTIGWQPLEWNISKTGKNKGKVTSPKLTEESLDSISDDTGKLIAKHIKCCHRRAQLAGLLECIRPDGRIPSVVNPQAAPTVRMTHKNIVNIPSPDKGAFFGHEMREIFIAAPGYVVVGCDSVSCQVRMLCHYMGDDEFTEVVVNGTKEAGTDIHTFNMNATGLPTRGHAKNFFYGFLFGAGDAKTGKLIKADARKGKQIKDNYYKRLPKLKALIDNLGKLHQQRGYLVALDGRKIYPRKQHELLVYLLQSAEAILMKLAMCYVNRWIELEGLDAHQVCIMHDEYTFEVREDQAERVKYLARQAIIQAGLDLKLAVPPDGDPKIGYNWAEIH